jgi:hypothetical protein
VSGVDGYACESCLSHVVAQFQASAASATARCGYCGKDRAYAAKRGVPLCEVCARQALETARRQYNGRPDEENGV